MSRAHAGSSRVWLLPALLSLLALVATAVLWVDGRATDRPVTSATDTPAVTPPPTASPTPTAPSPSKRKKVAPSAPPKPSPLAVAGPPRRVLVRSLGIDAPVIPIATQGTALQPPSDPQVLGWWSGGAAVGAAHGTALVTGHTVHAGGGAMDDLEQLRKGAEIRVATPSGSIRYVAESVQVLDKDTIAREAQRLFSQEVAGRLVLVTCEDWDGTGYRSNVVVTAVPLA